MAFSRVNTWSVGDTLTAAQVNQLDTNISNSLDKRSGQSNTVASTNTHSGTDTFADLKISGTIQYSTPKSSSVFLPVSMLQSQRLDYGGLTLGNLNIVTPPTPNPYIDYYSQVLSGSYYSLTRVFNINTSYIPNASALTSIRVVWQPFSFANDYTTPGKLLRFSIRESVDIEAFAEIATPWNNVPENIAYTSQLRNSTYADGDYAWASNPNVRLTTISETGYDFSKLRNYQLAMELGTYQSSPASSGYIVLYGLLISFTEATVGNP
jgi:hypothetical protein